MKDNSLLGTRPRVFSTNPDNLDESRIFVLGRTKWYERIEEETGAVAFTPIADSEQELRRLLRGQGLSEFDELDDEQAELIREEFLEQSPLYTEEQERSDEEPFQEQRTD